MPDETITEEQEQQVKRILERYRSTLPYDRIFMACCLLAMIPLLVNYYICVKFVPNVQTMTFLLNVYLGVNVFGMGAALVSMKKKKTFLRHLTKRELDALEHAEIAENRSKRIVRNILYSHKKAGYIPQEELLRPSAESQVDTLLRAAAYTDNAPQEQLLRPSQTDEK